MTMSWVVAYFPKSHEYAVIPLNWLLEKKGNGNGMYCLWPPNPNVTSEVAIRADPPDSTWLTYQIKVIANKLFDDYVQAWHHLLILVESSFQKTSLIPTQKDEKSNLSEPRNINKQIDACSSSQLLENINLPNDGITTGQETIMMNIPQSAKIQKDDSTHLNNLEINNLLYGIFNGGINITLMLSQVLSKLENLQTVFAEMNFNLPLTESFDAQFLEKFPINNPDALEHVEQCILNNNFDFGRKLEIYIKKIGGCSFKNHAVRALSKIITDEYATKCSWTGRGKEKLTKIRDTCLIKILKKVLQECYDPQINTDFEFKKIVAVWLKCSVSRYNRSMSQKIKL
ncbi:uncharacterized protein LOC111040740 isoform X2 [Myzus persicae]|uniref:uncharacterized protein LOC111040740 isoform X2 n=1 Tax=Myzus persicae TaxID=13164 RepID=UPI000B938C86|nr:uncharacterized protein LOC111040740 isoform X2 [Myzus persicae]